MPKISLPADRCFDPDPRPKEIAQHLYDRVKNLPVICVRMMRGLFVAAAVAALLAGCSSSGASTAPQSSSGAAAGSRQC